MTGRPGRAALLLLAAAFPAALLSRAAAAEAPKTLVPNATCANATCHADLKKNKKVHGPVASGDCDVCHVWTDNKHDFKLARKDTALCTECHDDILPAKDAKDAKETKETKEGKEKKKLKVHKPVAEDCTSCHSPHEGDTKAFLTSPLVELCEACHDEVLAKAKGKDTVSTHSAVLQGTACMTCHKPHTSPFASLLGASPMDTCLGCHDKTIAAGSQVLPNLKEAVATKKDVHGPIRDDKDCVSCHAVHGSKHFDLLTESYPSTFYAPFGPKVYALCFQCHEEGLAAKPETEDLTAFRNGARNLHYLHVHKAEKGRTCRACHDMHATDQPHLLRASVPFGHGGWSIPIRYEPTKGGGTCTSGCHLPRTYDRDKAVDYAAGQEQPKEAPPEAKAKEPGGS